MSKSLLQTEKECFITGRTVDLAKHHIYMGNPNRRVSEESGFWIWLTPYYHNMSNEGVHFNHAFDATLKRMCQMAYEDKLIIDQGISRESARDRFMKLIGRSYL